MTADQEKTSSHSISQSSNKTSGQLAWGFFDSPSIREPLAKRKRRMQRNIDLGKPPSLAVLRESPESVKYLWELYRFDKCNAVVRDRLIEYYLPWIQQTAMAIASKMKLHDPENAVGEVLVQMVRKILPEYDGKRDFERWAKVCIKRKLIDQQRAEINARRVFVDADLGEIDLFAVTPAPAVDAKNCDLRFLELTMTLSDRQAMILWLRYYRGVSVSTIADLLKSSECSVKTWTRDAIVELRRKFPDSLDSLPD
jgi:RNA polymerase sigma factor (sigma-70 family)